ncbi:SDR family NAD(P)-dependent oxidoreductase [Flavobacterium psychroterrae]|uniref:SDR family NAD(P)-dependent oxidoreductase n=1 Tax=Flavobacterium psychroterrae TaxID=2133767 RepID=A0ABS5PGE0_9FLAO|nr:SDR family NAD(P)-dependent oxidoreductase [Flavobacterium psychroterrae]MBS7233383.1 SDR family NAD(P)-dependent oxidoreductase [Flavobacterium psychroterrae]
MELKGKTILITGGTAGIGLEATKQFLEAGCKVIVTGRNQAKLDEAKTKYPSITAIQSDAAVEADAHSLFEQVKNLGGIDILYNNAGIMGGADNFGFPKDKHFEKAEAEININYLGVIRLNNIFMEMLKSRKEAAIINTSSFLSYAPMITSPTYCASKAAVRFYTVSLREHLQLINSNVKVFELLPPVVATEMTEEYDVKRMPPEELIKGLISGIRKNKYTIRLGLTKAVYYMHRFFPSLAQKILNPAKGNAKLLKA